MNTTSQSLFNLREFLLGFCILQKQWDPNFLLLCISFLLCMDLQPYSHDCFSKISRTFFASKKFMNNHSIPSTHAERKITFHSHKHSFTPYPSLSPYWQTERQTENEYTCYAWAGGTFFPVVLLCQFFGCGGNSFRWYLLIIPVVPLCHVCCCGGK